MKTAEQFFKEIRETKELRFEFSSINDKNAMKAFLQKHGCAASAEEFVEYVRSQTEGEIDDDAARAAAGGIIALPKLPTINPLL